MNKQTAPLFRATWKKNGKTFEGPAYPLQTSACIDALQAVRAGATFAAILRDSQGADHPANAGKFFLHRYVKA